MFERHDILLNTSGPFPEEFEAMDKIKLLIGLGYSLLVVLTILQVVSFYLYNERFHPFAKIVMPEPISKLSHADQLVVDALDANENGEDVAARPDTLLPSTDLIEQDEEEYNNFVSNTDPAEDKEECIESQNETSSNSLEDIYGLDQHNDIVADTMLNSAQDNAEQNISHSWPYFLSPYQAITLTYIKEL